MGRYAIGYRIFLWNTTLVARAQQSGYGTQRLSYLTSTLSHKALEAPDHGVTEVVWNTHEEL